MYKVIFENNRPVEACACDAACEVLRWKEDNTRQLLEWVVVCCRNGQDAMYLSRCLFEEYIADLIV